MLLSIKQLLYICHHANHHDSVTIMNNPCLTMMLFRIYNR